MLYLSGVSIHQIWAGTVFTRLEMHCKTPIEWEYYTATKSASSIQKDFCIHCAKRGAKIDQDPKKICKSV